MSKQNFEWKTFFKGVAMGAADIIPGISGGTIAFITGIYEKLLDAIYHINPKLFSLYKQRGLKACWEKIDGSFLLSLVLGIALSIISLAKITHYLLDTYPPLVWSFFFGLILASTHTVGTQIKSWSVSTCVFLATGIGLGYMVSDLSPMNISPTGTAIFFSGYIAVCAMILPGISGSFILLLLGMYTYMIKALIFVEIIPITIFLCGCILGLFSFARILRWLIKTYRHISLAVLLGFMIGSLKKVWPWKIALSQTPLLSSSKTFLIEKNVLPFTYESITQKNAFTLGSIFLLAIGIVIVFFLEHKAKPKEIT